MQDKEDKIIQNQDNLLKIEKRIKLYLHKHENKFDVVAYTQAALHHLETNSSLEDIDVLQFVKNDKMKNNKNDTIKNNDKREFTIIELDGIYAAVSQDGTIKKGMTFEYINDEICQEFYNNAKAKGKECVVDFSSNDMDKKKIFTKNAIMNFGITISSGYPNDIEFWKNLKSEYLSDKNHTLQDWERMSRLVPDDIMQRTPEEKKRNKQLVEEMERKRKASENSDLKRQLHNGNNPNLMTSATKSQPTPNSPSNNYIRGLAGKGARG